MDHKTKIPIKKNPRTVIIGICSYLDGYFHLYVTLIYMNT